jgi:hypothetical protein
MNANSLALSIENDEISNNIRHLTQILEQSDACQQKAHESPAKVKNNDIGNMFLLVYLYILKGIPLGEINILLVFLIENKFLNKKNHFKIYHHD